jgi:hypothetical protein
MLVAAVIDPVTVKGRRVNRRRRTCASAGFLFVLLMLEATFVESPNWKALANTNPTIMTQMRDP